MKFLQGKAHIYKHCHIFIVEADDRFAYTDKNMRHKGLKHNECVGGGSAGSTLAADSV